MFRKLEALNSEQQPTSRTHLPEDSRRAVVRTVEKPYLGSFVTAEPEQRSQSGVALQQGEASLFPQPYSVSCLQLLNHSNEHKQQRADTQPLIMDKRDKDSADLFNKAAARWTKGAECSCNIRCSDIAPDFH